MYYSHIFLYCMTKKYIRKMFCIDKRPTINKVMKMLQWKTFPIVIYNWNFVIHISLIVIVTLLPFIFDFILIVWTINLIMNCMRSCGYVVVSWGKLYTLNTTSCRKGQIWHEVSFMSSWVHIFGHIYAACRLGYILAPKSWNFDQFLALDLLALMSFHWLLEFSARQSHYLKIYTSSTSLHKNFTSQLQKECFTSVFFTSNYKNSSPVISQLP